jgi:hypothetical protein
MPTGKGTPEGVRSGAEQFYARRMLPRTVAIRPASSVLLPTAEARRSAIDEVLAHLIAALAIGAVLLLVPAGAGGAPLLAGASTGGSAFEAWALMRTAVMLQIGVAVLAIGLGALARARGAAGAGAERWCMVAALSAAAGAVLLVAPPL